MPGFCLNSANDLLASFEVQVNVQDYRRFSSGAAVPRTTDSWVSELFTFAALNDTLAGEGKGRTAQELELGPIGHSFCRNTSKTTHGALKTKNEMESIEKIENAERTKLRKSRRKEDTGATWVGYCVCSASIPSRTGIIRERTLPAFVSARTSARNASMAAALEAVFFDTTGISPAWCCAVRPR